MLRFHMYRMLKRINRCDDDYLCGDEIIPFTSTRKDIKALRALESIHAVELEYGDDEIYSITRRNASILYELERSDLWFGRIISFILGIMSALAVEYIIRSWF